jgi:hypothetical protein
MWSIAQCVPQVPDVPHLFPKVCKRRSDPRREEGELVDERLARGTDVSGAMAHGSNLNEE